MLKRLRSRSSWQGSMLTRHTVRRFRFETSEPEVSGGDDTAPSPMEYVVSALAGCMAVVVETVADERQLEVRSLDIDILATMDVRGFQGVAGVSPHFQEVTVKVRSEMADPEALPGLRAEVEQRCPAFNLLKDAGVPIAVDWSLQTGTAA